ncbi:MAG: nucleotidyltransferase domain-containing protein [Nitrospinae bacterium]|nr:nucleotidyltransferase domain-containing protein [Nitrospinota bacterium]
MDYYAEIDSEQGKQAINTRQLYETCLKINEESKQFQGYMVWKRVKEKEYLYKLKDTAGNGKSLGKRTRENEKIKADFDKRKEDIKFRKAEIAERLSRQAKYNKAAQISRLPDIASSILHALNNSPVSERFTVIGTYALYAYESMAGIQFMSDLTATEDIDLLWDGSKKMKVISDLSVKSMIELLRKADKSFTKSKSYSVVNKDGFLVDLIRAEPNPPWKKVEKKPFQERDDIEPSAISSQKWLVSSPKVRQCVIAHNGFPVIMTVPDPRSFILHKFWLSEEKLRPNEKKKRDKEQAIALTEALREYLPQYTFSGEQLRMFPKKIFDDGIIKLKEGGLL